MLALSQPKQAHDHDVREVEILLNQSSFAAKKTGAATTSGGEKASWTWGMKSKGRTKLFEPGDLYANTKFKIAVPINKDTSAIVA